MKKLIIILGCVAYLYGQTGKITGNILDASSEKPLVGVSVILINQGIGADTDQNGRYTIINVPLGMCTKSKPIPLPKSRAWSQPRPK